MLINFLLLNFFYKFTSTKCAGKISLSNENPIEVINTAFFPSAAFNGTPLCVNFGKAFTVLLDFAVFCDFKQGDSWASVPGNCTNLLNPFYIDDVRKPFEECKKSLRNGKLLMNCQSHLKKSFTIYWVNDYDLDASAAVHRSAFSFRLAELIDDKIGYHLEPFDAPMNPPLTPSLSLNWTNVSQPTWIALSTGKGLNYLQKLQTISDNPNCSYELITGAPPAKNDYEKRKLMKFNDSQPFIVQFLENNLYSLFVPSNCAVSIEIDKDERSEGNWYNEKQTICDGEAIVTTPAYSNELSCFPDAYYLQRVVQCADPIDVSVEVVALLSGKMSIEFGYTKTNKTKITLSTSSNLFCKHSGIGVKSVTIYWSSKAKYLGCQAGCFARVRVHPSGNLEDEEEEDRESCAEMTTTMKTTTTEKEIDEEITQQSPQQTTPKINSILSPILVYVGAIFVFLNEMK